MKHSKRLLTSAALGAAGVLLVTGCAGGTGGAAESSTLRLGTVTPLSSFAPWQASWANQSPYLQAVYDTLLRATPDGDIEAGLATEWSWDESLTVLTLTLRDDVEFSDGTALTAQTAAEALTRFRDGTSENASFLAGMESAEAADESTVVVTLGQPDPAFLVYLTQNAGLVGAESMWESAEAQTVPVGTGPYVLDAEATVVGSTYVYEARDDYWDPDSVHYDEVVISYYGDATSLMNAVKGGQVDASASQTPTQIAEAEGAGFTSLEAEISWTGFLLVDRTGAVNPAFEDVRVRQAFNYALDREGIVEALAAGYGTPTTQIFSTVGGAYVPELDERYPHDPERARELLAEAGYPDGLEITMPSNDFVPEAEFAIHAEQLGEGGFEVQWEQSGDDLFPKMLGGTWAAFPFLLQTDPTAWQTVQFAVAPGATWNPLRTEDATVQQLSDQLRTAAPEDSTAIAQELNEYLVEQAWFAPTYRPDAAFFVDADLQVDLQVGNAYPYLSNFRPAS